MHILGIGALFKMNPSMMKEWLCPAILSSVVGKIEAIVCLSRFAEMKEISAAEIPYGRKINFLYTENQMTTENPKISLVSGFDW
jgi:hypothetical protein